MSLTSMAYIFSYLQIVTHSNAQKISIINNVVMRQGGTFRTSGCSLDYMEIKMFFPLNRKWCLVY